MDTPTLNTGHIGLNVTDLDRSRQFYEQVFNFQTVYQSNEVAQPFAFLGQNNRLILTLWQQSEGRFANGRPGLHHLSFQVGDMAQVQTFESRLRELNITILYDGIVPHGEGQGSGGLFFEDPDGIRLEIFSPTGAELLTAPNPNAPTCGFF